MWVAGVLLWTGSAVHSGRAQSQQTAAAANLDERGAYTISLHGRPIGTEKFSIRSVPEGIEASADIQLRVSQQGRNIALKSNTQLLMNSRFEPQTYSVRQSGSPDFNLLVDFRSSPATSKLHASGQAEDDTRTIVLSKDVAILDDNVIHHYQILVDRFALKPEKRQTFAAYIPQEATPGTLTLEQLGKEEINLPGGKRTLTHLVMKTELVQIHLWLDDENRLQRLYNPSQEIEAIRKK